MTIAKFSLSSAQQALYLQYKKFPLSTEFNIPLLLRCDVKLEHGKLLKVLQSLAANHVMLTAAIGADVSRVVNVISDAQLAIEEVYLAHEDLSDYLQQKLHFPFQLDCPPLIRFYLIHKDNESLLFIVYHHIVTDDLPAFFIQDLENLYFNKTAVEKPTSTYEKFVEAEADYLQTAAASDDLHYWQSQTKDMPVCDISLLATDKLIDQKKLHDFYKLELSADSFATIKCKAKQHGVSSYVMFTSALLLLLHKYTGQSDLLVGTIINNRYLKNFASVLGDFTNVLLLRGDIKNITLDQLLKENFKLIISAMQHGKYPFHELVKKQDTQSLVNPFQVAIVHHYLNEMDKLKHFTIDFTICQAANAPLIIEVIEKGAIATIFFKYRGEFFNEKTIKPIADHYLMLLEKFVMAGSDVVNDISLITPSERDFILNKINATNMDFPADKCIHQLFEAMASQIPDDCAILCDQERVSYKELNERANQLANYLDAIYLKATGTKIPQEMIIALHLEKSIEAIVAILAILKVGAAYLPLDPTYPESRIKAILNLAAPDLILTSAAIFNENLHGDLITICLDQQTNNIKQHASSNLLKHANPQHLAYIIYTSGTTGQPNGVAVRHQGVCNLALAQGKAFGITRASKVLQFASLSFDASVSEIWTTLLLGGRLCLPWLQTQLMGDGLLKLLIMYGIEVVTLPPSILITLPEDIKQLTLMTLVVAGEAANKSLLDRWQQRVGQLINAYGPTEATVCATMKKFNSDDIVNNIGFPIANVTTYILDDNLHLVAPGMVGEIYIGGVGLARGYLNNLPLTTEKFIPDPFGCQDSLLYKTGDKGSYQADGGIQYRGRIDTQIKLRGFRIEIEEIENTINIQPEIKLSAVVIDNADNEVPRIICYLLPYDNNLSLELFKQKIAGHLPKYMLPHSYIITDNIPLTHNGKINRKQLLTNLVNIEPVAVAALVASTTTTKFINLCAEVLKIPANTIELTKDFFQLGGDSLSLLRLSHKIKTQLHVEIDIETIFDAPSLAAILNNICSLENDNDSSEKIREDLGITIPLTMATTPAKLFNNILLTGATGFLGIHLLARLLHLTTATIYCLVRGETIASIREKLQNSWSRYHTDVLDTSRIVLIKGELTQPWLGMPAVEFDSLASQVDTIYHCGAEVNHLYTYNMLRAANVLSTVELLKFAVLHQLKHIHYISTIDTITSSDPYFDSEANPMENLDVEWGYIQSKWVCENILYRNEVPFTTYRAGNITGNASLGISNPEKNHALLLMKSCIESGLSPHWDAQIEMTPVDVLSEIIIKLSMHKTATHKTFYNLHNLNTLTWNEYINIINELGYPIEYIAYDQWVNNFVNKLTEEHPLFAFKDIYNGNELAKLSLSLHQVTTTKTAGAMRQLGLNNVTNYPGLIKIYMEYLDKISFFNQSRQMAT
jgi:amino acid adenylation domain-containing protein/thioester reductase-like protein